MVHSPILVSRPRRVIHHPSSTPDPITKQCAVIDGACDVNTIAKHAENDGYTLTTALVTHSHFDHCGGSDITPPFNSFGVSVEGVNEWIHRGLTICVGNGNAEAVIKGCAVSSQAVRRVVDGEEIRVGGLHFKALHTPGRG